MIESAMEVAKTLEGVAPVLPGPVGAAVTAINAVATACTAIDAVLDLAGGWEWPW